MGSSVLLPTPGQPGTGPDPAFKSATIPKLVSFGLVGISPPSSLYIERDDQLAIDFADFTPAQTITITARLLVAAPDVPGQPDHPGVVPGTLASNLAQTIKTIRQDITIPAVSRSARQALIPLAEGYLLSVTATNAGSNEDRGATWVRAYINRGPLTNADTNAIYLLFADYVSFGKPVGWPGGRQLGSTEGPGNIRTQVVTAPASGADWTQTVPANARWVIRSINAQLTTSVTVASRIPRIVITDGVGTVWQAPPSQTVAASLVVQVSSSSGQVTSATDTTTVNVALHSPATVAAGFIISSSTLNLQAGDIWTNIRMLVEEWLINV